MPKEYRGSQHGGWGLEEIVEQARREGREQARREREQAEQFADLRKTVAGVARRAEYLSALDADLTKHAALDDEEEEDGASSGRMKAAMKAAVVGMRTGLARPDWTGAAVADTAKAAQADLVKSLTSGLAQVFPGASGADNRLNAHLLARRSLDYLRYRRAGGQEERLRRPDDPLSQVFVIVENALRDAVDEGLS